MTKHIMIDIETLDVQQTAVVTEIAAIEFDLQANELNKFYVCLYIYEQLKSRTVSDQTLKFWHFNDMFKHYFENIERIRAKDSIEKLANFINNVRYEADELFIWANSPAFDLAILKNLYQQYDIEVPWLYYEERDVRTVRSILPCDVSIVGRHHDPLSDCQYQIQALCASLSLMGK